MTIESVPIIAGKIPPPLMPSLGMEVKNSHVMADAPFFMIIKTMMDTGIMASIVAHNKTAYEIFCDVFGLSLNIIPYRYTVTKY
jgi:hypothetical protein